jgi:hypothetical protein
VIHSSSVAAPGYGEDRTTKSFAIHLTMCQRQLHARADPGFQAL